MEVLTEEQIRVELWKACAHAGTQKAWADENGVSYSYVTDVLLGRRGPGKAILDALGCERAGYRRKTTGLKPVRAVPPAAPKKTGFEGTKFEDVE